ncbi:zinc-binding dehydrogenase [Raineyella fluvialis]|uniref:Zinc-binding dehydrogenase n=2 Tax=Raineyella fluvialis TaxID=2662261 RepID=A0A5Q2FH04_9ACTN|nr:zinc-binding dehydrogenase [Raineyella fluvialis]
MNPADLLTLRADPARLPLPVGAEAAGVVTAVGPDTRIASGPVAVGDAVLVHPARGAWSEAITVPGDDVLAKPGDLSFPAAANLLLAGTTAYEALHAVTVGPGGTLLVHGASGAVGTMLVQLAVAGGVHVLGTTSAQHAHLVSSSGGEPVTYGPGLADRVRAMAPEGIAAAVDCVGTDEAVDVSLELLGDPDRLVTVKAFARAEQDGFRALRGFLPQSAAYRRRIRQELVDLAAAGTVVVHVAATYPLAEAEEAIARLASGHAGGKLALVP